MANTATKTRPKTKRPTRTQFEGRMSAEVKALFTKLTSGFDVAASPALTYVRISQNGAVLGYAIPSTKRIRLDVAETVEGAPAKARKNLLRGSRSDRRKIEIDDEAKVAEARELLDWLADQAV